MTHLLDALDALRLWLDAIEEDIRSAAPLSALTPGAPAPVGAQVRERHFEEEWSAPMHGHPPGCAPMRDPPTHSGKVVS